MTHHGGAAVGAEAGQVPPRITRFGIGQLLSSLASSSASAADKARNSGHGLGIPFAVGGVVSAALATFGGRGCRSGGLGGKADGASCGEDAKVQATWLTSRATRSMAWLRGLGGAIPGKGRAGNGRSEVEFSPDHIRVKDKKVQAVLNEAFEWERRLEPRGAQERYENALSMMSKSKGKGKGEKAYVERAHVLLRLSKAISDQCYEAWGQPSKQAWARDNAHAAIRITADMIDSAPPELKAQAHLLHAANLGRLAMFSEPRAKVQLSKEVRELLHRSLELDNELDYSHHALGVWYREMAGVSWLERMYARIVFGMEVHPGTYEQALHEFTQAAKINPQRGVHHIEMGKMHDKLRNPAQARACLQLGLALPVEDISGEYVKKDGERLWARVKGA